MKNKENSFFSNLLLVVIILISCFALSCLLVWPLWKISISFKSAYTIISLSILTLYIGWIIFKTVKKQSLKSIIKFIINFMIIAGGLILLIFFVISEKRLAALIVLFITIALIVASHFIWKKINEEK
ncbi:MAG: hypothetical protein MJ174_04120 [Treponema sp.]|nr:hypothetical protein [Treponema sp.]